MDLDKFKGIYLGQPVDHDGINGAQCVDLIKKYAIQVVGSPETTGNAYTYNRNQYPEYYEYHKNTLTYIPPKGAIAVWNKNVGYGYGHVGIVLTAGLMTFTSLEQNWNKRQVVEIISHSYTNVDCFLVPKKPVQEPHFTQLRLDLEALCKKYPIV